MHASSLALSIHRALDAQRRAPSRLAWSLPLLAVGLAAPIASFAAPDPAPANLGEQALMAQTGDADTRSPAAARFDAELLSGQARKIDLGAFTHGNPMVAGTFLVDVYVNGAWQGRRDLTFKAGPNGRVDACLDTRQLEELGIDSDAVLAAQDPTAGVDGASCVPVQQRMRNAFGRYDSANLRYDLSIPQVFLRHNARGYVSPSLWDRGINAGFVGYSFNAMDNEDRTRNGRRNRNAYLGLNAGVNLGGWQLRHNSNVTWNEGRGERWQSIATYAQRGIAQVQGMLTLGEAYTTGELFDSIGYRGASLATDDRMLPDSLRGYAPVVRGIAETNAKVEIRQNQQLIYSATVAPGNFVIDDLYPTGYGGDLEVTVVEADGRRRDFKVPFGSVPQMLRPGVSRYSVTAGQIRSDYLNSEPWLVQATYQRGVDNKITLYGGTSLSEGYVSLLYGAGLSTGVGAFAADITHARTRFERTRAQQGASVRLSYSNLIGETGTNLTLAAYRYSTVGYFGLADMLTARDADKRGLDPSAFGRPRSQFQLTLNQPLGQRRGSLYVTGSLRDFYNRNGTSRQYQLGYNNAWRSLTYGFSAIRTEQGQFSRPDTQYLLSVSMPLGRSDQPLYLSADLGGQDRKGYTNSRVGVTGSAGVDSNFSYGATLADSREGDTTATANAEYRSRYAALSGSYSYSDSYRQATLGLNGSLMVHGGGITLAPQRGDTMVLIEAPGAQGARVTNTPGLRVDGRGYAVVPYVSPYRLNSIALDPEGMSQDVELETSSQSVAPYAGSISHLVFDTRKGRAMLIRALTANGQTLPFGAEVKDAQGQPVGMVGQGGRLYIRSDQDHGVLQVQWGSASDQRCSVPYQVPAGAAAAQTGFITLEATCQ